MAVALCETCNLGAVVSSLSTYLCYIVFCFWISGPFNTHHRVDYKSCALS